MALLPINHVTRVLNALYGSAWEFESHPSIDTYRIVAGGTLYLIVKSQTWRAQVYSAGQWIIAPTLTGLLNCAAPLMETPDKEVV